MALTKKVNINDDALRVIAGMKWEANGRVIGRLDCGPLDRKLYEEVDKGLTALGGKWDRRAGGHVFAADPRDEIAALLSNGHVVVEKDGFFETPTAVTLRMLSLLDNPIGFPILEPSAGLGAIADVVREKCANEGLGKYDLIVCEKNAGRLETLYSKGYVVGGGDFLEYFPNRRFLTIIMNPPFEEGQDVQHVFHAFDHCLAEGGELVSVMAAGVLFREEVKYRNFRTMVTAYGRFEPLPEGSFKESGTAVNTCLVLLRKPFI